MAAPDNIGEMVEKMVRLGAMGAQMEEGVGYQTTIPPGHEGRRRDTDGAGAHRRAAHAPRRSLGLRYQNEGGSYMAYCKGMMKRDRTVPAIPSWAVFYSRFIRPYMLMPGANKPHSWTDEGYLRRADMIEALGRAIGVSPPALVATVARFNGFVARVRDEDFGRGDRAYDRWLGDPAHTPSQTPDSIEEAPFYAVPVVPGDAGTYGGVVTDAHARVLRDDGSPIPGLYATGVSTASVMGRAYPGAGASVEPSFTWGYVAARHASGQGRRAQAAAGTPHRARTERSSRIGGNTSLLRSQPCASWARCSISTISLSSLKMDSVNSVMNGHAIASSAGMPGFLTER
jgi:3-oxosteroid 1-dehydrogenase